MQRVTKPSRAEVAAAAGRFVPDVIGPGLRVLFCGINPSLYSAAVGHHFARPGNRFWPALHAAGLTERLLSPWEDEALLDRGYGVTNLVNRATATAGELSVEEFIAGRKRLAAKLRRYRPRIVAFLGVANSDMRALVIESEVKVPMAMANAFRSGQIGMGA